MCASHLLDEKTEKFDCKGPIMIDHLNSHPLFMRSSKLKKFYDGIVFTKLCDEVMKYEKASNESTLYSTGMDKDEATMRMLQKSQVLMNVVSSELKNHTNAIEKMTNSVTSLVPNGMFPVSMLPSMLPRVHVNPSTSASAAASIPATEAIPEVETVSVVDIEPAAETVVEASTCSRKNPDVRVSHANNDIHSLYKEYVVGMNGSPPLMRLRASGTKMCREYPYYLPIIHEIKRRGDIERCISDLELSLQFMMNLMNDPVKRKLRGKKRIKITNRPMRVFAAMIKRFHFLIMYNPNLYRKQHFNASVPADLLKNITLLELDQCIQFYRSKFN